MFFARAEPLRGARARPNACFPSHISYSHSFTALFSLLCYLHPLAAFARERDLSPPDAAEGLSRAA
eukprot:2111035-Rhodomonas_salina.1